MFIYSIFYTVHSSWWGLENEGQGGHMEGRRLSGISLGKPFESFFFLGCVVGLPAIFWFLSQLDWMFKQWQGVMRGGGRGGEQMRGWRRRGEDVYGFCCMLNEHFSVSRSVTGAAYESFSTFTRKQQIQSLNPKPFNICWSNSQHNNNIIIRFFQP